MCADTDGIKQALRRNDLPRGQVTMLKYLYEHEGFVSTAKLAAGIRGGDSHSCISILGPFSQRVNGTDRITGKPGYEALIQSKKCDGQTVYKLRDDTKQVIESMPPLLEKFECSISELRSMDNPVIQQQEFDMN